MPGEAIRIGPFNEGLDLFNDAPSVSDNALVECLNFEPDYDGSLRSRPPVVDTAFNITLGATGNAEILGTFFGPQATPYTIANDGLNSTYYYDNGAWSLLTNTFAATAMAQFDNKAWLLAPVGSASPGGYWTLAGGFVADVNMPKGEVLIVHKLRLWVALGRSATTNGTRLYFSKLLGVVPFWLASPDFVDIGAGDGQNIVQAVVYYQSIVLFRTDSIYSFTYTTDPSAAVVAVVVPGVGLTNKDCITPYENYLYFLYRGRAYEFVNSRVTQINNKVPFKDVQIPEIVRPFSVSLFNGRVLYQWWDYTYIFYLNTRTWTRWRTNTHGAFGKWWPRPDVAGVPEVWCISAKAATVSATRMAKTLSMQDGFNTRLENFQCIAQTKSYSYEAATVYKRMYWWSVIASFTGMVTGVVVSVGFRPESTWGQIRRMTWGQLRVLTWGRLASDSYLLSSSRTTEGSVIQRKTVKMSTKSFRFKQIYFTITFDSNGTKATSPVRLNSLMTYVRAKQTVSKTVS
jgi:hypothetical protein